MKLFSTSLHLSSTQDYSLVEVTVSIEEMKDRDL